MKEKGPDHEKGEDYEDIEHQMNPASLQPREPAVAKSKDVPRKIGRASCRERV